MVTEASVNCPIAMLIPRNLYVVLEVLEFPCIQRKDRTKFSLGHNKFEIRFRSSNLVVKGNYFQLPSSLHASMHHRVDDLPFDQLRKLVFL